MCSNSQREACFSVKFRLAETRQGEELQEEPRAISEDFTEAFRRCQSTNAIAEEFEAGSCVMCPRCKRGTPWGLRGTWDG